MSRQHLFTSQLIDFVIAVLKGANGVAHTNGLPANWFPETRDANEMPLVRIDHGDPMDYTAESLTKVCPIIFVRGMAAKPADLAQAGSRLVTEERLRLVHVRLFEQCRDDVGDVEQNLTRARERYAEIIDQVLFADQPLEQLGITNNVGTRSAATLATVDTGNAYILHAGWGGWDLGRSGAEDVRRVAEFGAQMWAIACDLIVHVECGGVG